MPPHAGCHLRYEYVAWHALCSAKQLQLATEAQVHVTMDAAIRLEKAHRGEAGSNRSRLVVSAGTVATCIYRSQNSCCPDLSLGSSCLLQCLNTNWKLLAWL